jgi:hypothetical protein
VESGQRDEGHVDVLESEAAACLVLVQPIRLLLPVTPQYDAARNLGVATCKVCSLLFESGHLLEWENTPRGARLDEVT